MASAEPATDGPGAAAPDDPPGGPSAPASPPADGPGGDPASPPASAPPSAPPAPPAPGASPPSPGAIRFTGPLAAIEHLARARSQNDRTDALRAANAASVHYVFGYPASYPLPAQRNCERTPSGAYAYHCFFYYEGGGQNYYVNFSAATGFRVVKVQYVAD
ncbi:hypothetical protein DPM19_29010 [Actinomadura craniellae]|uniref:Uncharacterized protein n=1 Tax=Actinomadura craniellae TaxID=2231787 RepID=A0A365GXX0_9ACTN|nr:hypothetical protein DPM19_29010 [Actinomadura craniellae]